MATSINHLNSQFRNLGCIKCIHKCPPAPPRAEREGLDLCFKAQHNSPLPGISHYWMKRINLLRGKSLFVQLVNFHGSSRIEEELLPCKYTAVPYSGSG